jgi:hypothetical protein
MKRIALFAMSALLATPATAQDRACRDIRALVNAEGGDFRSIGWSVETGVGVFLTVQGRRVDLPAARDCDLTVDPSDETGFYCTWEVMDSTAAGAIYDRLLARISPCVNPPLEAGTPFAGTGLRIVQSHDRSFVTRGRNTDLNLSLFEYPAVGADAPGGPRPIRYVVAFSVTIDTDRVVPPEEVEEEGEDSGS